MFYKETVLQSLLKLTDNSCDGETSLVMLQTWHATLLKNSIPIAFPENFAELSEELIFKPHLNGGNPGKGFRKHRVSI